MPRQFQISPPGGCCTVGAKLPLFERIPLLLGGLSYDQFDAIVGRSTVTEH